MSLIDERNLHTNAPDGPFRAESQPLGVTVPTEQRSRRRAHVGQRHHLIELPVASAFNGLPGQCLKAPFKFLNGHLGNKGE